MQEVKGIKILALILDQWQKKSDQDKAQAREVTSFTYWLVNRLINKNF